MPFIGNDIISLNSLENKKSFLNSAYLQKAFTLNELNLINSNNKIPLSFLFWTCKESAYKVMIKMGLVKQFSPKNYSVELMSFSKSNKNILYNLVNYNQQSIFTCSTINKNYIHTIASNQQDTLNVIDWTVMKNINSPEMYKALIAAFSKRYNIDEISLLVDKNVKTQAPFLIEKTSDKIHEVSFSHDNEYVAFAFLLP